MEGNQRMMFGNGRRRSGSRLVNNFEQDSQRGHGSASDILSKGQEKAENTHFKKLKNKNKKDMFT